MSEHKATEPSKTVNPGKCQSNAAPAAAMPTWSSRWVPISYLPKAPGPAWNKPISNTPTAAPHHAASMCSPMWTQ